MAEFIVVYDNYTAQDDMQADWGFACVVKHEGVTGLFDTGAKGEVLLANLATAGVEPSELQWVLISHDHWDHTGGLADLLAANSSLPVYLLPVFSDELKQTMTGAGASLVEVQKPAELAPGVFTTGLVRAAIPEQSLVVVVGKELIVVTGCSHPGIAKIVRQVKDHWPQPVRLVFGGFHLGETPDEEVLKVARTLRDELEVQQAGPTHCSGRRAQDIFAEELGEAYVEIGAGRRIEKAEK